MSINLGASVLGYVLPSNREGMEFALTRLTDDHFTDKTQRTLFGVLRNYGERYGDVFPGTFLVDLLRRNSVESSKSLLMQEAYNSYVKSEVQEHAFHAAIDGLVADNNKLKVGQVITTAFDILEHGVEVDGDFKSGYQESSEFILNNIGNLDRDISEISPEGNIRDESDDILNDYLKTKLNENKTGVRFGIPSLDAATSGMQPGDFVIIAAFTNQGKSQYCVQTSWHASVVEGKPCYFATTETVRNTTRRRILARHSRHPDFGHPTGLDSNAIKNGTLTPDEEVLFHDVVKDFTTNSNYAPLYIAQMPRSVTINYLENSVNRVSRQGPPFELLVADYLQLWSSVRKRSSEREEFNEILRDAKKFATTFDKGRGIPFLTPWQMSREAFENAKKAGQYSLSSLSDTSEAEKIADLVISLLRPDPTSNDAILQALKARDAPSMDPSGVYLDYRSSYLGETNTSPLAANVDLVGGFDMNQLLQGSFDNATSGL